VLEPCVAEAAPELLREADPPVLWLLDEAEAPPECALEDAPPEPDPPEEPPEELPWEEPELEELLEEPPELDPPELDPLPEECCASSCGGTKRRSATTTPESCIKHLLRAGQVVLPLRSTIHQKS